MPSFFTDLLNNHVLVNTGIAWFTAQSIKILLLYLKKKTLNISLLMSPGGMPSTHSTIVVTVAATIGRDLGWHSPFLVWLLPLLLLLCTMLPGFGEL